MGELKLGGSHTPGDNSIGGDPGEVVGHRCRATSPAIDCGLNPTMAGAVGGVVAVPGSNLAGTKPPQFGRGVRFPGGMAAAFGGGIEDLLAAGFGRATPAVPDLPFGFLPDLVEPPILYMFSCLAPSHIVGDPTSPPSAAPSGTSSPSSSSRLLSVSPGASTSRWACKVARIFGRDKTGDGLEAVVLLRCLLVLSTPFSNARDGP